MRASLQTQKGYILENFDFNKVKRVMDFLNWTWADIGGVPEIGDLQKCADYLMYQAISRFEDEENGGDFTFVGTGGFTVHIYPFEGGDCMELSFDVASYSGNLA